MEIRTRDPEEAAAERFAQEDRRARVSRRRAASALRLGDLPGFFAAAADCARAMSTREAITDAAVWTMRGA